MGAVTAWKGARIDRAGLYSGVEIDLYHGTDLCIGSSISSTGLRTIFQESAAHYWDTSPYNTDAAPNLETDGMILGRAAHHLLLGEADFASLFVLRPDRIGGEPWHSNRTACRAWLQEQSVRGLSVLKPDMRDRIVGMRAGLAAHPMIDPKGQVRLLEGMVEHTIVWRDEETGIWLKVRPDVIPSGSDDVVDLKTTLRISDEGIDRAIVDGALNMQGAMSAMAWRAVFGRELSDFTLVFVETKRPHVVRVKTLKPSDLELGERQVRAALRLFARCVDSNRWPGPGGEQKDAEYASIKPFHLGQIETRLQGLANELRVGG